MMKKILLISAALAAIPSSFSRCTCNNISGFYVGANIGGVYTNSFKEYARHSSQDSDSQTELFDLSKDFGFVVGLHVGYGHEFKCGFYVGGQIYANYDFTKIDNEDDGTGKNISRMIKTNKGDVQSLLSYEIDELKPCFGYGAALHLGFKVSPKILVYGSVGVEGTHTTAKQVMVTDSLISVQNDFGNGFNFDTNTQTLSLTGPANDEMSVENISIVPGIGAKYFFNSHMYVGAQLEYLVGINKKIDGKHYNTGSSTNDANIKTTSFSENGIDMYSKRNAFRYGISVGYKF